MFKLTFLKYMIVLRQEYLKMRNGFVKTQAQYRMIREKRRYNMVNNILISLFLIRTLFEIFKFFNSSQK